MTDGPMYWSSNDQAGWYQSQHPADQSMGPPPPHQQHHAYHQPGSYHQMHAGGPSQQQQQQPAQQPPPPTPQSQMIPSDHTSPGPQTMINGPTPNGSHHMQSTMPPQVNQSNQPPVNNYNQQHHMPNVDNVMHNSPNQQQQQQQQPMSGPPPALQSQSQMQSIDSSNNYTYAQQPAQAQVYSQQSNSSPNSNYPPPVSTNPAAHSNGGLSHGPSPVSSMHQQSPIQQHQQAQSMYPPQQYSPAPYWNSGPPPQQNPPQHQQSSYGPPPPQQSSPMMHHQGAVPTPPSMDGPPNYSMGNGVMPVQHQQQPPPPPPPSANASMPYDSRASTYGSPYPPQAQSYYGSHDQSHAYESQNHHHMPPSHQQQIPNHQPQTNWSNGYYQPNSSYSNGPSHYSSMPQTYNGASPSQAPSRVHPQQPMMSGGMPLNHHQQHHHMNQQQQHLPPPHHQNGPQPPPPPHHHHYGSMQQSHLHQNNAPHLQQRWPPANQMQPNQAMPISDRNNKGVQEKKPVKPRAPRQRNPNAPAGRRKDPIMTSKEHKRSGYAQFYQLKRKELKAGSVNSDNKDFGDYSRIISDLWAQLSDDEKATYATEVNNKRKEMLKKKASQQAQDLVQGITQE